VLLGRPEDMNWRGNPFVDVSREQPTAPVYQGRTSDCYVDRK
jgi:hypothetical protein